MNPHSNTTGKDNHKGGNEDGESSKKYGIGESVSSIKGPAGNGKSDQKGLTRAEAW